MKKRLDLHNYETQATLSILLATVAALAVAAAGGAVLYKFNWQDFILVYNRDGFLLYALAGTLFVAMAASVVGFCVALNSAGQRRNAKSRLSWLGFFCNAALMALALMIGFLFLFTRQAINLNLPS